MFSLFSRASKDKTSGARILVAALQNLHPSELMQDHKVYLSHFRHVEAKSFDDIASLKAALALCDMAHLLINVDTSGSLEPSTMANASAGQLLDYCIAVNVKAVWFAAANSPDSYLRGVPAKPCNLIMTMDRKGQAFARFLDRLCSQLTSGVTFPDAWVRIAPQDPLAIAGGDMPECIFYAGRPKAILLP